MLSKIDELRERVKASNATDVGITESKLYNSRNDREICIEGYKIFRRDRNRKGGGVLCYVSNAKECISNEIENIFVELLTRKTKQITGGIIYKPPDQLRFLETLLDSLNTVNILNEEWYIYYGT